MYGNETAPKMYDPRITQPVGAQERDTPAIEIATARVWEALGRLESNMILLEERLRSVMPEQRIACEGKASNGLVEKMGSPVYMNLKTFSARIDQVSDDLNHIFANLEI